jgi:hypothetical protein
MQNHVDEGNPGCNGKERTERKVDGQTRKATVNWKI